MQSYYPLTANDRDVAGSVLDIGTRLVGAERVVELDAPSAGSEDFSYILQKVPGALAFLGVGDLDGEAMELHDPRLRIDERAMAVGVALHAAVAMELLGR